MNAPRVISQRETYIKVQFTHFFPQHKCGKMLDVKFVCTERPLCIPLWPNNSEEQHSVMCSQCPFLSTRKHQTSFYAVTEVEEITSQQSLQAGLLLAKSCSNSSHVSSASICNTSSTVVHGCLRAATGSPVCSWTHDIESTQEKYGRR